MGTVASRQLGSLQAETGRPVQRDKCYMRNNTPQVIYTKLVNNKIVLSKESEYESDSCSAITSYSFWLLCYGPYKLTISFIHLISSPLLKRTIFSLFHCNYINS